MICFLSEFDRGNEQNDSVQRRKSDCGVDLKMHSDTVSGSTKNGNRKNFG